MKILDFALSKLGYVKAAAPTKNLIGWTGSNSTKSGIVINNDSALTIAAVYACISVISEDVAKLPIKVYRKTGNTRTELPQHPISLLLRKPHPLIRSFDWRQAETAHTLGWGNGYNLLTRNYAGDVIQITPLAPSRVTPQIKDGALVYEYQPDTGSKIVYSADRIMHLRGMGYDGLVGYNVIQMARESMGLAKALEQFSAQFFGSGANQRGVLKYPNALTQDAFDRLREGWVRQTNDSDTRKPIILENGMEWAATSVKPEEAQFLESRAFSVPEVCRWFRMPPHKIADLSRSTFSNIEEQNQQYVDETLMGWIVRWEQALMDSLLTDDELSDGLYIKHNVDALLRGNTVARHAAYASGKQWGYYSSNDIREKEDMNPIEGGDVYLQPSNMVPLGTLPVEQLPQMPDDTDDNAAASILFADAASRICSAENRELVKHLPHAQDDLAKFEAWAADFFAKHQAYVERTIYPLGLSVGARSMTIESVAVQICDTGLKHCTGPAAANHWADCRSLEIQNILKEGLK